MRFPAETRRCEAPHCWEPVDYLIPKGATIRSRDRGLHLCVGCLEALLDRLACSVTLDGEPCELEQTLIVVENAYDGGRDYQSDLGHRVCQHQSCERARAEIAAMAEVSA